MRNAEPKIVLRLFIFFALVFLSAAQATAEKRAVLVIGDKRDLAACRIEIELRARLTELRDQGEFDGTKCSRQFLAYDLAVPGHREACERLSRTRLGDLPLLAIVQLDDRGKQPTKLLWKMRVSEPDEAISALMRQLGKGGFRPSSNELIARGMAALHGEARNIFSGVQPPFGVTQFQVLAIKPEASSSNISCYAAIALLFSEPVHSGNLSEAFQISPAPGFPPRKFLLSEDYRTLVIGGGRWAASTTYTVAIREGSLQSRRGRALRSFSFQFTTGPSASNPEEWELKDKLVRSGTRPITRYFHPQTADHLYVGDPVVRASVPDDYKSEGVVFSLFDGQGPNIVPFRRFFSPAVGDHFYTSGQEREDLATSGYVYEGHIGYIATQPTSETIPLLRFWSPRISRHLYTTSSEEGSAAARSSGFQYEGIAGYVLP